MVLIVYQSTIILNILIVIILILSAKYSNNAKYYFIFISLGFLGTTSNAFEFLVPNYPLNFIFEDFKNHDFRRALFQIQNVIDVAILLYFYLFPLILIYPIELIFGIYLFFKNRKTEISPINTQYFYIISIITGILNDAILLHYEFNSSPLDLS